MKLKWQITIIAVLSLSFPWVVWQAFTSLNQTFQTNMLDATAKQAQVILNSVVQFNQSNSDDLSGFIAVELVDEVAIDGNDSEWTSVPWYVVDTNLSFKLGRWQNNIHLLIQVNDSTTMANPSQQLDQLMLAIGSERGISRAVINRQAVGRVTQNLNDTIQQAYWNELADGYRLELAINENFSRLGIVAIDHDVAGNAFNYGHTKDAQIQLQPLFQAQPNWQSFLANITPEDGEIKVTDTQGRSYYQTKKSQNLEVPENWLTELIYEFAFDESQHDGSDFFGQSVATEFAAGSIELTIKQNAAQAALIQNFIRSTLWIFLIALGLLLAYFLYALILAWRIRRLNKTLQTALDDRGHIKTQLPSNQAGDEIGDLSRGMSTLLAEINAYTEYLKQLGSRLSHEMKTPISIVHTSLENLYMEQPENEFVARALNANHRLKFILNQLSALSQLKQVISETKKSEFDLNQLLNELAQGYQSQAQRITFQPNHQSVTIKGSEELMSQMLDKLVQNALEFTTTLDTIKIALTADEKSYHLTVSNTGSQIPTDKIHQLFDSLTSFRNEKNQQPHLGLGLYIAKLICDYHNAQINAKNLNEPKTVVFTVSGSLS